MAETCWCPDTRCNPNRRERRSPPTGAAVCHRPPPYVGDVSSVVEATPFAGSTLFRPNDGRRHARSFFCMEAKVVRIRSSRGTRSSGPNSVIRCWPIAISTNRTGDALPASLKNVETSKVLDAVDWLRRQPFSNGKVALFGFSMGAEMALIIGSLDAGRRLPDALVAHSPGQFFDPPFNPNWVKPSCWTCVGDCKTAAPQRPDSNFKWHPQCGADTPDTLDYASSGFLTFGASVASGTRIPIEKFDGPILLIQGEDDTAWHGRGQTRDIEESLGNAGSLGHLLFPRRRARLCRDGRHGLRNAPRRRVSSTPSAVAAVRTLHGCGIDEFQRE